MARPWKKTADYFPHFAGDNPQRYAIMTSFGHMGYAFWYLLQELLCESEGLFYDCSAPGKWQYLLAKTAVCGDQAEGMLTAFCQWGLLDQNLWETERIIWCQELADSLNAVFSRRKNGSSFQKPGSAGLEQQPNPPSGSAEEHQGVSVCNNPVSVCNNPVSACSNPVSAPQRKANKTKENQTEQNETKENQTEPNPAFSGASPEPPLPEEKPPEWGGEETDLRAVDCRRGEEEILSQRFLEFWQAYPKKANRKSAWKVWEQLSPGEELFSSIMSALSRQQRSAQWLKNQGQYIPYPANWLQNRRWEDELDEAQSVRGGSVSYDMAEFERWLDSPIEYWSDRTG